MPSEPVALRSNLLHIDRNGFPATTVDFILTKSGSIGIEMDVREYDLHLWRPVVSFRSEYAESKKEDRKRCYTEILSQLRKAAGEAEISRTEGTDTCYPYVKAVIETLAFSMEIIGTVSKDTADGKYSAGFAVIADGKYFHIPYRVYAKTEEVGMKKTEQTVRRWVRQIGKRRRILKI